MSRPGLQLLSWTHLQIGALVFFFTGAGWKKATVLTIAPHSTKLLFTQNTNERQITITDLRNIRTINVEREKTVKSKNGSDASNQDQGSFIPGL